MPITRHPEVGLDLAQEQELDLARGAFAPAEEVGLPPQDMAFDPPWADFFLRFLLFCLAMDRDLARAALAPH